MKKHFLKSAFFAAMTALMLVSIGCGKENKTEEPKPDEPKPENLAPKFDAAFAAALQSKGVIKDAANITAEEIAGVTKIDVSGTESAKGSLTSLKGIEFFKALYKLVCANNNLTSLDLGSNAELEELYCGNNNLKEIKVAGLTKLHSLDCNNNAALKKIDISSCINLRRLWLDYCGLEIIDVTKNAALELIAASCNDLVSIDIGQNTKLKTLIVDGNPGKGDDYDGIFYVFVPKDFEVNALPPKFTQKGWKYQTRDVNLIYRFKSENLAPKFDVAFAKKLVAKGIIKDPEFITAEEIAGVTKIDVSGTESAKGSLTSLKGIEFFKALYKLVCANNNLTSLDLGSNAELEELYCGNNNLKEIKVAGLTKLHSLDCNNNAALKKIDISSCVNLWRLWLDYCGLEIIDVTKNTALELIDASCNDLASIDIRQNPKLKTLIVDGNPGQGDDYDGVFFVYVPKDFEVNAPPANFTQKGWKYQTRDVNLIYYHL